MTGKKDRLSITTRIVGSPLTCRFTVDRTVHTGAPTFFRSKKDAKKSSLARKIFSLDGIESIKISKDAVAVTRDKPEDWPSVTRKVAAIITEQLASGKPAVDADAPTNMRSPEEIRRIAQEIVDKDIAPQLSSHGGGITLLDVKDATIYVKLGGGCQGCQGARMTLKNGVERAFRQAMPELDEVIDATDHAGGANPYQ